MASLPPQITNYLSSIDKVSNSIINKQTFSFGCSITNNLEI